MAWITLPGGTVASTASRQPDELAVSVALHAAAEHGTGQDVEGGKQRRRAVTGIVVGLGGGMAGGERPIGAGPLQRLDLALLVDGQHHRVGGRVYVEADDILDLGGEGRVTRALERAQSMRLEAVSVPDPLHGAQRYPNRPGCGTSGPMGDLAWWLRAGQRQHFRHRHGRVGWRAGRTRLVAPKTFDARLSVALLPAPHGRAADARPPSYVLDAQALG
jgi:hypothetical protein